MPAGRLNCLAYNFFKLSSHVFYGGSAWMAAVAVLAATNPSIVWAGAICIRDFVKQCFLVFPLRQRYAHVQHGRRRGCLDRQGWSLQQSTGPHWSSNIVHSIQSIWKMSLSRQILNVFFCVFFVVSRDVFINRFSNGFSSTQETYEYSTLGLCELEGACLSCDVSQKDFFLPLAFLFYSLL